MGIHDEDKSLLQKVANGDKNAMHQIYTRHHDALYSFIRMRCDSDATTQDVVHDAMLEVWTKATNYAGRSAVRTWIFAIARNKLIDRTRKSSQLSYLETVPDEVDDAPDPEVVLENSQNASRLKFCLDKLKAAHRAVIRLAFFDDLAYEDIAEVEGIPLGTVKTRIFHAKQGLMHCLGQA